MVGKKNKFAEATHATRKGKAIVATSSPSPKQACQEKEIIMLPLPPPPPRIEEPTTTQLNSSSRGTPSLVPVCIEPSQEEAGTRAIWPHGIQHQTLALTRMTLLHKKPWLSVLIA